ncbi:MAG: hypothetical protein ACRD4O_18480, partial [Bryobacteraceae bacterium]
AIELPHAAWRSDAVSGAVLAAATGTGVTLYNALQAGNQTAPELRAEALMLGVLSAHLRELGFHRAMRAAILSHSADTLAADLRTANVAPLAEALQQAGAHIAVLDLQVFASRLAGRTQQYLPALAGTDELKLTGYMIRALERAAKQSPESLTSAHPRGPSAMVEPAVTSPCEATGIGLDAAAFYFGIAALAASTLAVGVGIALVGLMFGGAGMLHQLRGC